MEILGRDCGCGARKAFLRRQLRRVLLPLLGLDRGFGEHLTAMKGHLAARVTRVGGQIESLDLGLNTITDAGVQFLVDDFDGGGEEISNMNYHAWGTGSCSDPPACVETALTTEASESRISGTTSQPAANQYRTVAEFTADGAKTITEWGLLSASSGGTLWSVRCFTGIALTVGDKIEFTYTLTIACVQG